jgi:nitrogen regulatory protein P-II 1
VRKVEAIIKPFKLDVVTAALRDVGVVDLTVSNVRGFGRQAGDTEIYRGHAYVLRFVPRLKIEFLVAEDRLDVVLSLICRTARSQTGGNGKILVSAVEDSPTA